MMGNQGVRPLKPASAGMKHSARRTMGSPLCWENDELPAEAPLLLSKLSRGHSLRDRIWFREWTGPPP